MSDEACSVLQVAQAEAQRLSSQLEDTTQRLQAAEQSSAVGLEQQQAHQEQLAQMASQLQQAESRAQQGSSAFDADNLQVEMQRLPSAFAVANYTCFIGIEIFYIGEFQNVEVHGESTVASQAISR